MKISDIKIGDMIYFKCHGRTKFLFGEVRKIYEDENAISVMSQNTGFHTVHVSNAAWTEKEIKKLTYKNPLEK